MKSHERNGRARAGEGGFVFVVLLVAAAIVLLIGVTLFLVLTSASSRRQADAAGAGGGAAGAGADVAAGGEGGATLPPVDMEEIAKGGAGLVCAYLPGQGLPRTNALDRRVMRFWLALKQDLDGQGIRITTNWGFRTACQQKYVNAGGNKKARVGESPHQAGRAIDINGMKVRGDRFQIIATFRRNGWKWMGSGDPPHFDIQPNQVGEGSGTIGWIRKNQAAYDAGQPTGGCRGTPCGGVTVR